MPESHAPLEDVRLGRASLAALPDGVQRVDYRSPRDGASDWAFAWPHAGATWLVNLHGHGSDGSQLFTRPDIRRDWLPLFRGLGLGVLTPNLRGNAHMSPDAAADLRALLAFVRAEFSVDRFFFAGGSMGGTGNLIYAVLHPDDVAGAVAMCPTSCIGSFYWWCSAKPPGSLLAEIADAIRSAYGGTPEELPEVYRRHSVVGNVDRLTMPVYIAHGTEDAVVPVGQSLALAEASASPMLKFRQVAGNHDAPLAAALMKEGMQWVLTTPFFKEPPGNADSRR